MNWAVLGKISGIICAGGGFGFSAWLFWPNPTPVKKYIHVYTISEAIADDTANTEININVNRNFECRLTIPNSTIPCDLFEPKSLNDKGLGNFKNNPTKITKNELKKANNIYVLRFEDKYNNHITSSNTPVKIDIVSTQETNKKYATLKVTFNLSDNNSTQGSAIKAIMSDTKNLDKTQKQFADIIEKPTYRALADKVFDGCEDLEQNTSARCSDVSQSLDILINKIGKSTTEEDVTNSDIETLANGNHKTVSALFDTLSFLEKSKKNSTYLSFITLGLSDQAIDLFSGWYTKQVIKGIKSESSRTK